MSAIENPIREHYKKSERIMRIFERVVIRDDGCWGWDGAHGSGGYAVISSHGSLTYAHRFFYEELNGPAPEGFHLHHQCRNKWCVNPGHLEAVAATEHQKRHAGERKPKTHCPQGHRYEHTTAGGKQRCLVCRREESARYRESNRAQIAARKRDAYARRQECA